MPDTTARRAVERLERIARDCVESRQLRSALLAEIRRHVSFDAYAWLLTDPTTEVGSDPLADVPCLPELPHLIRLKYATETLRWTGLTTRAGRLQADTGGHPERSLVWREMLSSYDVGDVASVVFRDRFGCWGFLDLWRAGGAGHFSEMDAAYLSGVSATITQALRRCQGETFTDAATLAIAKGPAVLVLSPELTVTAQTAETEAYLRTLVPPQRDLPPVPAGAYNVAGQLLANEAGVDDHPPRARVHLQHGTWLSLRAARITTTDAESSGIAVTVEAASPAERLDLFSRAHALSRREDEVLTALAQGADTHQLASELFVSEHTVQDHLKSIFAKTGVRSRRGLIARALGS